MRVVAIVPAWRARSRLPEVLAALAGQVERTVVVDNGSDDGSVEWLAKHGAFIPPADEAVRVADPPTAGGTAPSSTRVDVIANAENRGYAAAVNQGIARALALGADAVLLVNDDAVAEPGAVEALARELVARPGIGATTGHLVYRDRPDVLNGAGGTYDPRRGHAALRGCGEPDDGRYASRPDVDYPSGAWALLSREALKRVGAMDEGYHLYFEDADWGLRARRSGLRTRYVPEARARHVGSAGTGDDPARRRYYNVRNRLRLAGAHAPVRGRARAWLETLALVARQPARWPSPSRRRDAEAVLWGVADHLRRRYGRSERFG